MSYRLRCTVCGFDQFTLMATHVQLVKGQKAVGDITTQCVRCLHQGSVGYIPEIEQPLLPPTKPVPVS